MRRDKNINANQNEHILSPEEMKQNLEKINMTFNNYLKSLTKDFDNEPNSLKDSVKYSTELIDSFKQFYNQYNLLSEDILIKPNQNVENKNISNAKSEIIIDNMTVKGFEEKLIEDNFKLEKTLKENGEKYNKILEDLNGLTIKNK